MTVLSCFVFVLFKGGGDSKKKKKKTENLTFSIENEWDEIVSLWSATDGQCYYVCKITIFKNTTAAHGVHM